MLTTEDSTLENQDLTPEAKWSYYVSSYSLRDPTEGVAYSDMHMPFLKRNLPPKMNTDEEYNEYYKPLISHEGLVIRICANSYHILYEPGTEEWWWRVPQSSENQKETVKKHATVKEKRKDRFKEKFVNNPSWAHGLSRDEVDESNQRFRSWVGSPSKDALPLQRSPDEASRVNDSHEKDDEVMSDAE